MEKLSAHRLRFQRFQQKAACIGTPCVKGILPICGKVDHIRMRTDLKQLMTQVKTVCLSQIDIQKDKVRGENDEYIAKGSETLLSQCK